MAKEKNGSNGSEEIIEPDAEIIIDLPEDAGGNEGADSLREQLDAANKATAEANRRADEREAEAKRLAAEKDRTAGELQDSRTATLTNAIAVAEADKKDLRGRLIAAKQAGDFETEADINLEMAQLATRIQRLNEGKNALESEIENRREEAKRPPADPVEAYAATLGSARARDWVRSHPEVVTNTSKSVKVTAAHWSAIDKGIADGSDEYFDFLEQRMGYGGNAPEEDEEPNPQPRRQSPPAAPPSRSSGGSAATLPQGQHRLSAAEREIARASGISDAEYLTNKLAIQRENSNTTH